MHDHQHENKPMSMSDKVNILVAIVQIISHMVELFVRRPGSFGTRYVGLQFVLSWGFLFFFPVFFQHDDPAPVLTFWLICTAMLLIHRIAGVFLRTDTVHSLSVGRSWFSGSFSTQSAKEFVFVMAVSFGVSTFSIPLATYLFWSAVCLAISMTYVLQAEKARLRAAIDARLDAEWMQKQLEEQHHNGGM
jgi:hypothetical protein